MSNAVSHSPFEMVLHLDYLQVSGLGTLNGLLAAQMLVSEWLCVLQGWGGKVLMLGPGGHLVS